MSAVGGAGGGGGFNPSPEYTNHLDNLPIGVPYHNKTTRRMITFSKEEFGESIKIEFPGAIKFSYSGVEDDDYKVKLFLENKHGFLYPQREFIRLGHSAIVEGGSRHLYKTRDWFRLIRIGKLYSLRCSSDETFYEDHSSTYLSIYSTAGNLHIDIDAPKNSFEIIRDYVEFGESTSDFFLNLWKIELETLDDEGRRLWDDYHRSANLAINYGIMIRDACDRPITVINMNLTDLNQEAISMERIGEGEYFITNYDPPPANLSTNSIFTRTNLISYLLSVPVGGDVHRDLKKRNPIVSITKVRIQYSKNVNTLPALDQVLTVDSLKRQSEGGGAPEFQAAKRARAYSLGGGGKSKKRKRRKSKSKKAY